MTQDWTEQLGPEALEENSLQLRRLPIWLQEFIERNRGPVRAERDRIAQELALRHDSQVLAAERREEERFKDFLRLLQITQYAEAYREAVRVASDAQIAYLQTLTELTVAAEATERRMEDLRNAAATLPDGRKVFPSATDGRLYLEDGSDVSYLRSSVVNLSSRSPTIERLRDTLREAAEIQERSDAAHAYNRDVLRPAQDRLSDIENAPDQAELRDIARTLKESAPLDMQLKMDKLELDRKTASPATGVSAANSLGGSASLNAPDLFAQFRAAAEEIPLSMAADGPRTEPAPGQKR